MRYLKKYWPALLILGLIVSHSLDKRTPSYTLKSYNEARSEGISVGYSYATGACEDIDPYCTLP